MEERFLGELETLRADNVRLHRLLELSEEQARATDPDQATLTGAPQSPISMRSAPEDKVGFFLDLFRCRSDAYALRWENRRNGRSGWMPAIRGYWREDINRADAPYLPLTPTSSDNTYAARFMSASIHLATMTAETAPAVHDGRMSGPGCIDGHSFSATPRNAKTTK